MDPIANKQAIALLMARRRLLTHYLSVVKRRTTAWPISSTATQRPLKALDEARRRHLAENERELSGIDVELCLLRTQAQEPSGGQRGHSVTSSLSA